jgi:hypothetical protein
LERSAHAGRTRFELCGVCWLGIIGRSQSRLDLIMIEERVGQLEREQARQGERLGRMEADLGKTAAGVERLLERDAKRPSAVTGQTIVATCAGLGVVAGVVWWLIGSSPAVQELDRRLTRLDDPEVGRVPRIEKELGWTPRIVRGK